MRYATIEHENTVEALNRLRPEAQWVLRGDVLEWVDEEQTEPTAAELEAEIATVAAERPWKELRKKRDRLIKETDWWASSDLTMTADQTAYRQALRDLPANTADPANPVWPVKPGLEEPTNDT